MALFEWDEQYSVGSTLMDEHHKRLFDIINRLHAAMTEGKGANIVCDVLKELVDYTKYHFSEEEKMMAEIGYPNLEMHRIQHEKFISDIESIKGEVEKGVEFLAAIKVLRSTQSWLQNHILKVDAGYSSLIKANA
jgi:hemerythrin